MTESRATNFFKRLRARIRPSNQPVTAPGYWDAKYSTEEFIYTTTANRFVVELCSALTPGKAIDLAGGALELFEVAVTGGCHCATQS